MPTLFDEHVARAIGSATDAFRTTFVKELERFLPERLVSTIRNPDFLSYIVQSIREDSERFALQTERQGGSAWEL